MAIDSGMLAAFDAQQKAQPTSDIGATPPAATAITPAGQPAATPTGKIDYGQVADSLRQIPSAPAGAPSNQPPALPQSDNSGQAPQEGATGVQPQQAQSPNPTPVAPPTAPVAPKPDLFANFPTAPSVPQINQSALNPPQPQATQDYVNQQQSQKEAMALKLFTPQQVADFKANPITFSNMNQMGHLFNINDILPGASVGAALVGSSPQDYGVNAQPDNQSLANIVSKIQGMNEQQINHTLTVGENETLRDAQKKYAEIQMRGFAPDFGGKAAKAIFDFASLPSWMIQFTAGGELAAGVKAVTGLTGVAGAAAATVARAVPFLPNIVAGQGEALLNQSMAITDKGQTYLKMAEDSPTWALLHSTANVLEDNALALVGGKILDTVLKTPISYAVNKFSPEVRQGIYDAVKAIQPSATMSKVFSTGWSSALDMLGFAVTDPIAHAATNVAMTKNYSFDDFRRDATPTTESLVLGLGIAAIHGGASYSKANATGILTGRGMPEGQAVDAVNMMSENEREQFVNQNVQMPKSAYPETRGQGQQYHGTSSEIPSLQEYTYDNRNIYGQGFYTTDALDIAKGYSKKGGGDNPTIYKVNENGNPKLYDMEQPINSDAMKAISDQKDNLVDSVMDNDHPKNLRELYDGMREQSENEGYSRDGVQEVFDGIATNLREQGYDGLTHAGGILTGKKPHKVNIYFNPAKDVSIEKYAPSTVQTMDEDIMQSQIKSSEAIDPPSIHDEESNYNAIYRSTFAKKAEQLYAELVNRVQPIENLSPRAIKAGAEVPVGENTENLTSMAQSLGLADANMSFKRFYREGGTGALIESGKALKPILDDFDNMFLKTEPDRGQRQADFSQYQTARRQLYLDETRPRSEASPADLKEHQDTIDNLEEKYGSKFTKFDNNYSDRSKETWDKTFSKTETDAALRAQDFKDYTAAREQLDIKSGEYILSPEMKAQRENELGQLKEKYGKDFGFFETLFKENMEYRIGTFHDHLVKTGLVSQADFAAMVKRNEVYAPDYRNVDEEGEFTPSAPGGLGRNPNADKIGSVGNQAKGGDLESKNVFESDIKNTVSMVTRGENNRMKLAIAKKASFYPDDVQLVKEPSRTSITYFENGEAKYMEVSPVLQKAFSAFSTAQKGLIDSWIDSIMKPSKHLLQIGATSMPQFLTGHFERSIQLGLINSLGKATPMDMIRGIYHVMGNTENFKEFQAATGLGVGHITLDDPALEKMRLDMQSGMKITDLLSPQYIHDTLMKYADMPARVGTYNGLIRNGVPQLEAAIQARQNTMDYSRMGSFVKDKLSFAPFLNPPIQGMDKMLNLFKDHPGAMTTALLLSQTVPQMLLTGYYLYGADQKTRDAYLQIPAEARFVHQYIHFGDDPQAGWVGIRRPFTPGYIFGSMPEQAMIHSYVSKNGGAEPANFYGTMLHGLAASGGILTDPMSAFPPIVKAAIEGSTNYNMFWGQPLFKGDTDLPKSEWRTPSDTDFANWLGGKINMSPAMIDNTISDMSGGLGKWVVQAGGNLWNDASRAMGNKVPEPVTGSNDFLSGFTAKPTGYSSQSVQELYDRFDEVRSIYKEAKALDKSEAPNADQYREDHAQELEAYDTFAKNSKGMKDSPMAQLTDINKQIREVKADPNMNGDQKKAKIDDLNNQMTDIAKKANDAYNQATKGK